MARKTSRCVECGETVPGGRLSCPSCGAVLAAVAGSRRRAAPANRTPSPIDPPARATAPPPADAPRPSAFLIEPSTDAPDPAAYLIEPMPTADEDAALAAAADAAAVEAALPWPPLLEPEPVLVARPYGRALDDGPAAPTPPPGAYLPPRLAPAAAATMALDRSPARATDLGTPAPEAATARTGGLPAIDRARLVDIAGWFVVVGSTMAALGFLLPWSAVLIGARSIGGYLDGWGLASPSHAIVLAALLATLGLSVVTNPLPAWLRTGVLGLVLGGLLVGLTWPYVVGPLGADIGALATVLGGVSMAIGGGLATWATRHEPRDPAV